MTCIVHISADYPDAIDAGKTKAIANLVGATARDFDHQIYSLNRANSKRAWLSPGMTEVISREPGLITMRYHAPRWGLFLSRAMEGVAAAIDADLTVRGIRPDLIHGHKLSIEGLAAQALAAKLGIPFAISLQGNTDAKVIAARPDLRRKFISVWQDASYVFAFAPWIERWCRLTFGPRGGGSTALPCILASEQILAPSRGEPCISTAFNLDFWKNKNLQGLLAALAIIRPEFPNIRFKIAGSGSQTSIRKVTALVAKAGLTDITSLDGLVPAAKIQTWMNDSTVFVLASHRETFGMVFVEALLAGTPIVYPAGAAIDGYFDDAPFALPAGSGDPQSIASAIAATLRSNARLKEQLREWQAGAGPRRFQREAIASSYRTAIKGLIA
jgi:glycosyltransferase involved in cell wall biosynthesis